MKAERDVVIGSMLSKLCTFIFIRPPDLASFLRKKTVLVLGLCFFAGGMRFSEQVWNPSEQYHFRMGYP